MNRTALAATALAITAPLTLTATVVHATPSAKAGAHAQVKVHGSAKAVARAAARVEATAERLDRTLDRLSAQAHARLDADVSAKVQANIAADISMLADLSVQAETATTMAQVRAVAAQVKDVRVAVYARIIGALETATDYAEEVQDSRASVTIALSLHAGAELDAAQNAIDAAVALALTLQATSSTADLAQVNAHLSAAAKAIANARA